MNLQEFIEHRKDIKKPMTERAIRMLDNRLNRLDAQGYDKALLLEDAIINGWQSVYPKDSCKKVKLGFIEKHTDRKWSEGL